METVNQETNATTNQAQSEPANDKMIPQDEVNKIVQDRISRERAKFADYEEMKAKAAKFDEMEEAGKSELQKAQDKVQALEAQIQSINKEKEISQIRTQVAQAKGVPADLLTGETQEACESQADKILSFAQAQSYPVVKDGGEPHNVTKKSTRDSFKEWAEKSL